MLNPGMEGTDQHHWLGRAPVVGHLDLEVPEIL